MRLRVCDRAGDMDRIVQELRRPVPVHHRSTQGAKADHEQQDRRAIPPWLQRRRRSWLVPWAWDRDCHRWSPHGPAQRGHGEQRQPTDQPDLQPAFDQEPAIHVFALQAEQPGYQVEGRDDQDIARYEVAEQDRRPGDGQHRGGAAHDPGPLRRSGPPSRAQNGEDGDAGHDHHGAAAEGRGLGGKRDKGHCRQHQHRADRQRCQPNPHRRGHPSDQSGDARRIVITTFTEKLESPASLAIGRTGACILAARSAM